MSNQRSRLADIDLRDECAAPVIIAQRHVGIDLAKPGERDRTVITVHDTRAGIIDMSCDASGLSTEEKSAEHNQILNQCMRCGSTNHIRSACRYLRPGDLVNTRTCNATGGLPYAGNNNADGGLPIAVKLPLRLIHDRGFPFCSSSGYYHAVDADGKRCYVTDEDITCLL